MADTPTGASSESWGPMRIPTVSRKSLISTIQRQLDENSDNITLSRDEGTEAVLTLSSCSTNEAKLAMVTTDLRIYQYFATLGDYAGRVVDWVRKATANKKDLPSSVSKLRNRLAKEISTEPHGGGKLCEALEYAIKALSERGLSVDFDMVQLAINVYSERNRVLHSELRSQETADNLDSTSRYVDRDLDSLRRVLPDDQLGNLETWRKILAFYPRSQEIAFEEDIRRKLRASLPHEDRQLRESNLRKAFQEGKFRQNVELESGIAESRQRSQSDPTNQVRSRKRKATVSPEPGSTESAGQARGKPRRKLSRKEVKFVEKSEALMDRINNWHSIDPRHALQWVNKISAQLDSELQEAER